MSYIKVEIPGGGTGYENSPSVQIIGGGNSDKTIILKYASDLIKENEMRAFGEITFTGVLEYRWVTFEYEYYPYDEELEESEGFELIQIIDSKWVENMASKSPFRNYPNRRFGPFIKESDVKHFRISFDDYGCFDIICLEVVIRQVLE